MYKFYEFFNPVLMAMKDGRTYTRQEVAEKVAEILSLTDEQRAIRIKSGRQTYIDRTQWAMTYLKQAGALSNEKRSRWAITERGIDLVNKGQVITLNTLKQYPEYVDFTNRVGTRKKEEDIPEDVNLDNITPTDLIGIALERLNNEIEQELLDILKSINPYQFEHICKDLLIAMGYGGNSDELSYVTSKSGDGGIDAVIKQDPLGINMIYIQAKRHQGEIRETDIRNFLGALAQKPTQNGVFITTGTFSDGAKKAIQVASSMNIIPIDGDEMAKLMIQYRVGVDVKNTYYTFNIDSEYFDE